MILLILGPSGCGKGTQAKLLSERLHLPQIGTGDLLREAYEKRTPEGLQAEIYWRRGKWAPSKLVMSILKQRLDQLDCENGFILDGVPRDLDQVQMLENYLNQKHKVVTKVFHLETSDKTAVERIQHRIQTTKKIGEPVRMDETPMAIKQRLSEYHKNILPILNYYEKKGILERINNEGSIKEVQGEIWDRLRRAGLV